MKNLNKLKVKTQVNYKETLLSIPVGETRAIKTTVLAHNSFTTAATRLRKKGIEFTFTTNGDGILHITRQS